MRLQSWPSTEPTVESPAAATGIIIYGGPDTAEASGMIIHGSGPAVEDGAIIFWRPVPSGL